MLTAVAPFSLQSDTPLRRECCSG